MFCGARGVARRRAAVRVAAPARSGMSGGRTRAESSRTLRARAPVANPQQFDRLGPSPRRTPVREPRAPRRNTTAEGSAMPRRIPSLLAWAALAALDAGALAQSNTVPGTDVKLGALVPVQVLGHGGAHPTGYTAITLGTTACNVGTVDVPWIAAMQANHPVVAFLVARELNGRMRQISDRSYVKHTFSALSNSLCTPCQNPSNGTFLGVGCSDTYSAANNSDAYHLGPAWEIDPWLGSWTPACSYFDQGDPAASPPQDCDSFRSLTSGQVL